MVSPPAGTPGDSNDALDSTSSDELGRTGAVAGDDSGDLAGRIDEASREQELRDPDEGLGRLGRTVNRVAEVVGVAALGTIVAVIFANAVGRYAFNTSLIWAEELVLLLVPWLAMTGVFLSVRRGTMIRIDHFFGKLPRGIRRPLGPLGHLFSAIVLTFMAASRSSSSCSSAATARSISRSREVTRPRRSSSAESHPRSPFSSSSFASTTAAATTAADPGHDDGR